MRGQTITGGEHAVIHSHETTWARESRQESTLEGRVVHIERGRRVADTATSLSSRVDF